MEAEVARRLAEHECEKTERVEVEESEATHKQPSLDQSRLKGNIVYPLAFLRHF